MANMIPISTVTVGSGGAANIEFTSIPSTYTDLNLVLSGRTDNSPGVSYQRFNISFNSSTANFTSRVIEAFGTSVASYSNTTDFAGYTGTGNATTSTFSTTSIYIPNYASSNNKSYSIDTGRETNSDQTLLHLVAGLWSNSAAITAVKLTPTAGNFVQYSSATLYGIRKY